jgi:hypothetical protein
MALVDFPETKAAAPPPRAAPTYRFVCHLCGEDEILLYRPPPMDQHVCGACEEHALVSGVERRRLLHWWPFALGALLVVVLACVFRYVPM